MAQEQTTHLLGYVFQPYVSYKRNIPCIEGFEALARCAHIPALSVYEGSASLIQHIDFQHQIETFVSAVHKLHKYFSLYPISFNLDSTHFTPDNVLLLSDLCRSVGVDRRYVELELIESSEINHVEFSIEAAKRAGFRLALDDFGAGYSNVGTVIHYPFDKIKFDRAFLLGSGPLGVEMLNAMHAVIKKSGFLTTIEGVESESEMVLAKALSPDYYQGWLFGRGNTSDDLIGNRSLAVANANFI